MFAEVMAASGSEREAAFMQLRRMLAVHETAEEEIVHPRAKSEIPNGDAVVAERLKEENAAKKALAELEEMDVDSTEFETAFAALQSDVIAHAEAEETQEFNMLGDALDDDKLQRMRRPRRHLRYSALTSWSRCLRRPGSFWRSTFWVDRRS